MKSAEFTARMKLDNRQALDAIDETERGFDDLQNLVQKPLRMDRETYRRHAAEYEDQIKSTHRIENERNAIKDKYLRDGLTKEKRTVFDHFEKQMHELRRKNILGPFQTALAGIIGQQEKAPETSEEWESIYGQAREEAARKFSGRAGKPRIAEIQRQESLLRLERDLAMRQAGDGGGDSGGDGAASSAMSMVWGMAKKYIGPAAIAYSAIKYSMRAEKAYEDLETGMQTFRASMGKASKDISTHDVRMMMARGVNEYAIDPASLLTGMQQFQRMGMDIGPGGKNIEEYAKAAERMALGGLFQTSDQARSVMGAAFSFGGADNLQGQRTLEYRLNAMKSHMGGRDIGPASQAMSQLWGQAASQWGGDVSPDAMARWTMAMVPEGGRVTPMSTQVTGQVMSGFGQRGGMLQNMLVRELMDEGKSYWEAMQIASDPNNPENIERLQKSVRKAAGSDTERQKQLYYMMGIPMGAINSLMGASVKNLKGGTTDLSTIAGTRAWQLRKEESKIAFVESARTIDKLWNPLRAAAEGEFLAKTGARKLAVLGGNQDEFNEGREELKEMLGPMDYENGSGDDSSRPGGQQVSTPHMTVHAGVINISGGQNDQYRYLQRPSQ